MNEKMKKALHQTLRPGETVRWESATQPFRIIDGREGRRTLIEWVISVLCIGAITVYFTANGGGSARFYLIMAVLLAIFILSPIFSYRELCGQYYLITQTRALMLRADGSVYAMELRDMGECRLYPLEFGGAALALGSTLLEEKDKQLRWRACHPQESADATGVNAVRGLVFYHVDRADEAMRLLNGCAAKEV